MDFPLLKVLLNYRKTQRLKWIFIIASVSFHFSLMHSYPHTHSDIKRWWSSLFKVLPRTAHRGVGALGVTSPWYACSVFTPEAARAWEEWGWWWSALFLLVAHLESWEHLLLVLGSSWPCVDAQWASGDRNCVCFSNFKNYTSRKSSFCFRGKNPVGD